MRISDAALAKFKGATGELEPIVHYVRGETPFTIGYAILPEQTRDSVVAERVSVRQLETPHSKATCHHERAAEGSDLFFLVASQQTGALWYSWTDRDGVVRNMLVHATDEDEGLRAPLMATHHQIERWRDIWRVSYKGDVTEETASQVLRAVKNKLPLAYAACEIARRKAKGKSPEIALAAVNALQENPQSATPLLIMLGVNPNTVDAKRVLSAAAIALQK